MGKEKRFCQESLTKVGQEFFTRKRHPVTVEEAEKSVEQRFGYIRKFLFFRVKILIPKPKQSKS